MTEEVVLQIISKAIWTAISSAAPLLLLALGVGLIVSIFQAVTSIQDPTLAFVPKILAVFGGILFFGSFIMGNVKQLVIELFTNFSTYIH